MKISVVIPAFNASATIDETIASVLGQCRPADEILVLDDGSTDDTFARLSAYSPRIKVFRRSNQGLSSARNFLCRHAAGDVVAFLDADDVWHSDYLKTQHEILSRHPDAAASFTGFLDSNQFGEKPWSSLDARTLPPVEVMDSVRFFRRYNHSTVQFPPSACCVTKSILNQMGDEPFPVKLGQNERLTGAEDFWFMNVLPLFGKPVVYNPLLRVMYRLSPGSLSTNRIKMMKLTVLVCEVLVRRYQAEASAELWKAFREVFPAIRRSYSKFLMGAGRFSEARVQIKTSIKEARSPKAITKSAGLLFVSYLPSRLQPKWPRQFRQHDCPQSVDSLKVSVVIPTYNAGSTIRTTLDSVLAQTSPAHEILALDDGSTDGTPEILRTYQPRITVMQQKNQGVASARNALCARASGDLIAFIDHDDLWHPDYLKTQKRLFTEHPDAVAFFAGHTTLYGNGDCEPWDVLPVGHAKAEIIPAVEFIRRYHLAIGKFMSMSFCCVPTAALQKLGERPFCEEVSGVDDSYLLHQLPLFGSIVYFPAALAAYRITRTGQSADRIKSLRLSVRALELLCVQYLCLNDARLRAVFSWAFATRRREYGKVLMSADRTGEARHQFFLAMGNCWHPVSVTKSVGLLFFSYMPRPFQPRWLPVKTAVQSPDLNLATSPAIVRGINHGHTK